MFLWFCYTSQRDKCMQTHVWNNSVLWYRTSLQKQSVKLLEVVTSGQTQLIHSSMSVTFLSVTTPGLCTTNKVHNWRLSASYWRPIYSYKRGLTICTLIFSNTRNLIERLTRQTICRRTGQKQTGKKKTFKVSLGKIWKIMTARAKTKTASTKNSSCHKPKRPTRDLTDVYTANQGGNNCCKLPRYLQ